MWKLVLLRLLLVLAVLVGSGFAVYKWGWNNGAASATPTFEGPLPGDPLREKASALKGLEATLPKLVQGLSAQAKRLDEQAQAEEELKQLLEQVEAIGEKLASPLPPPRTPTPAPSL